MFDVSLCVLAFNRPEGVRQLVESVRAFDNLRVEVVIGDNSTSAAAQRDHRELADFWFAIEDRELWFEGFGICKMKIVRRASNDLVMIGDPDEKWSPVGGNHSRLLRGSQEGHRPGVFRTALIENGRCVANHGRVFHRRRYGLYGMIHEEVHERRTRKNWSVIASDEPFALVGHDQSGMTGAYRRRKGALYDHLLDSICRDPESAFGTRSWWWREYWPSRLLDGYDPVTFEQWQETCRG